MKYLLLILCACLLLSCEKTYDAPIPSDNWPLYESGTVLNDSVRYALQGVYSTEDGASQFGGLAVLKWSFTISHNDTVHHLSLWMEKDITTMVCEGRRIGNNFLLKGYWRKMLTTETGLVRLTIDSTGGGNLINAGTTIQPGEIKVSGVYGLDNETPAAPLTLKYLKPLASDSSFYVLAHRGGGRSSDLLSVSENSVEMMRMASRLGATGIEIDVRLTHDGVPVLYHDEDINDRLTQNSGLTGPLDNYTYSQLSLLVRLVNGEKIPTLEEALNTVLRETPLRFVWLDTKFDQPLTELQRIQERFLSEAETIGRDLQIVIGVPDEKVYDHFIQLPDYVSTPSLCELDATHVQNMNANIWAPRWTEGLLIPETNSMHAQNRKVFSWTLDIPEYIQQFVTQGSYDGLLTNYPSVVSYYYYAR